GWSGGRGRSRSGGRGRWSGGGDGRSVARRLLLVAAGGSKMALATTVHAKTIFFAILAGFRRDAPACVQLHWSRSCTRRGTGRRSRSGGGRGRDRRRSCRCSGDRGSREGRGC